MPKRSIRALFFTISALIVLFLIGGTFWLYDYVTTSTKMKLEHLSHEKAYDVRYKVIEFYDLMSYRFDSLKPEHYKKLSLAKHYFDIYGMDAPLEPLKKELESEESTYDIYLINRDLIVKRTTFLPDLGFDFHFVPSLPELFAKQLSDPNRIDQSIPYYEASSSVFKRNISQRSNDGNYIIQISQTLKQNEHSFAKLINNLEKNTPALLSSSVYSVFSSPDVPWNVQEIWAKKLTAESTNDILKNEDVSVPFKNILLKIDPTASGLFISPKLYLHSYLATIFENNVLKESYTIENGRYLHLIMLPLLTYYNSIEKSYSLLVMEFDETQAYEKATFLQTTIFIIWSITVLLVFLTMFLIYRRIVSPIFILQKHMNEQTPIVDKTLLDKGDEISNMSQTYNWLLNDLKEEISKNKDLLLNFKTFTANAIHQVRTPLSVIKISLEMLEDSIEHDAKLHIHSSVVTMEHLYNSLAFSIQNEEMTFPVEPSLDVASILQERIKLFKPVADSFDKAIILMIRNGTSVDMNRMELEFLIDNNLSNALKYGNPLKPIYVSCYHTDTELILSFESYGKEIKNKEQIFERYVRQDKSKQGSGIGLNIVSTICKRYHILIQVTYENGKNCFRYFIPLK